MNDEQEFYCNVLRTIADEIENGEKKVRKMYLENEVVTTGYDEKNDWLIKDYTPNKSIAILLKDKEEYYE